VLSVADIAQFLVMVGVQDTAVLPHLPEDVHEHGWVVQSTSYTLPPVLPESEA